MYLHIAMFIGTTIIFSWDGFGKLGHANTMLFFFDKSNGCNQLTWTMRCAPRFYSMSKIVMAHNIGGRKKGPVFGPWHFPGFLKISKGPNSTQKSIESRLGYMMG